MAGSAVATAGRPVLKGLNNAQIRKNITVAIVLSITSMFAYKFLVNEPKKRDYAEFYKTYDAEAAFERMRKAGLFQSAPADD
ncbi:Cytochrome c oxidase subunit 6C [Pseudolycoriella hygida]|uniref:Cytochrome c oxidase subunit 6C n=1 Tax=Pseudolycoriella hygida TaxID=35572 RepID=A0A9Q0MX31_9DIPT|nr:Cytochrome c oxidase subunit 6C [Pseudolycoriella hygida]